jgi:hypothetical protein
MAAVAPSTDLKRLAFVETAAANSVDFVTGTKVFSKACGYYSSAKETNALKVRRATRLHAPQTAIASRVFPRTRAIWRVTTSRACFAAEAPHARATRGLRVASSQTRTPVVFPRDVDVASFFSLPTRRPQGSLTKIEDLIKAYGTPVVSKVQEKYPAYMTTVDAKVRPRPSAASERTTWRFFTAPRVSTGGIFLDFFVPTASEGSFSLLCRAFRRRRAHDSPPPLFTRPSSRFLPRWTPP